MVPPARAVSAAFQQRDHEGLDDNGEELSVTSGSPTLDLTGSLVVLHRRLDTGRPAVIELESSDPETNFCLVHTYVGIPVP